MAYSKLGIINLALAKIGDARVEDLTEDSEQRIVATTVWEYILDEVLEAKAWHFAKSKSRLLRMDAEPSFGFSYVYGLPEGFLRLSPIRVGLPPVYPNDRNGNAYPHVIHSILMPYGLDKITNGSFTGAATGWTLGTLWTYGSNKVTKAAGGVGTLSQAAADMVSAPVIGETYLLSLGVDGISGENFIPSVGGVSGIPIGVDGDNIQQYITAADATGVVITPSAYGVIGSIDNVSLFKCNNILVMSIDYEDSEDYPLYIESINRIADVTRYSPAFVSALAFRLAAEMALRLTEGMAKYNAMMGLYVGALTKAEAVTRSMDSLDDEVGSTSWIDAGR
jgi:hypothetical protein